jgi:chlorite dismutase
MESFMTYSAPAPLTVRFTGGDAGAWRVIETHLLCGEALPDVTHIDVTDGEHQAYSGVWTLTGVAGHVRYTTRAELNALGAKAAPLQRPEARCAALIPIRKSVTWWALAQDERRAIYEDQSRHTTIGLDYLPRIARRLHHSRDLGEPFDFLTWFEFAPEHETGFDELLARLRATEEWTYVERELDIRLQRV